MTDAARGDELHGVVYGVMQVDRGGVKRTLVHTAVAGNTLTGTRKGRGMARAAARLLVAWAIDSALRSRPVAAARNLIALGAALVTAGRTLLKLNADFVRAIYRAAIEACRG